MPDSASRHVAFAAMLIWPPSARSFSKSTTRCPRSAETRAASSPAGPPPTTTTRRRRVLLPITWGIAASRPVAAFWMQSASLPT